MQRNVTRLESGEYLITCDLGDIRYRVLEAGWRGPYYFLAWQAGEHEAPFASIPYGDVYFFAAVKQLTFHHTLKLPKPVYVLLADDTIEQVDWTALHKQMKAQALASHPIWCPVANMIRDRPFGPGGQEIRHGTSDIAPGAKVYCHPPRQHDGYERVQVTAHHRVSHRLITIFTRAAWLEHWRVERVYDPRLIMKLIHDWDWTAESKTLAERLVEAGKSWARKNPTREESV